MNDLDSSTEAIMQNAQQQAIQLFINHASRDGDANTLTKSELRDLFKDLGALQCIDLDQMMELLDKDGDNCVSLEEFTSVVEIQRK